MSDPVEQLSESLDVAGVVIEGIGDEQWTLSTPCTEWNVRDVVVHLIEGNRRFARALEHSSDEERSDDTPVDLVPGYRRSATELVAAYRQPDVLTRTVTVPFGTVPGAVTLQLRLVEALVHGWDLDKATRQNVAFPDELVDGALRFSEAARSQIPPERSPFGPPQPVAESAPAIDRLAAFLGRPVLSS